MKRFFYPNGSGNGHLNLSVSWIGYPLVYRYPDIWQHFLAACKEGFRLKLWLLAGTKIRGLALIRALKLKLWGLVKVSNMSIVHLLNSAVFASTHRCRLTSNTELACNPWRDSVSFVTVWELSAEFHETIQPFSCKAMWPWPHRPQVFTNRM